MMSASQCRRGIYHTSQSVCSPLRSRLYISSTIEETASARHISRCHLRLTGILQFYNMGHAETCRGRFISFSKSGQAAKRFVISNMNLIWRRRQGKSRMLIIRDLTPL